MTTDLGIDHLAAGNVSGDTFCGRAEAEPLGDQPYGQLTETDLVGQLGGRATTS
jgi:hypothetical protein